MNTCVFISSTLSIPASEETRIYMPWRGIVSLRHGDPHRRLQIPLAEFRLRVGSWKVKFDVPESHWIVCEFQFYDMMKKTNVGYGSYIRGN